MAKADGAWQPWGARVPAPVVDFPGHEGKAVGADALTGFDRPTTGPRMQRGGSIPAHFSEALHFRNGRIFQPQADGTLDFFVKPEEKSLWRSEVSRDLLTHLINETGRIELSTIPLKPGEYEVFIPEGLPPALQALCEPLNGGGVLPFPLHSAHSQKIEEAGGGKSLGKERWSVYPGSSIRTNILSEQLMLKMTMPVFHTGQERTIKIEDAKAWVAVSVELLRMIDSDVFLKDCLSIQPEIAAICNSRDGYAHVLRGLQSYPPTPMSKHASQWWPAYAVANADVRDSGSEPWIVQWLKQDCVANPLKTYMRLFEYPQLEAYWRSALKFGIFHMQPHTQNSGIDTEEGWPIGRCCWSDFRNIAVLPEIRERHGMDPIEAPVTFDNLQEARDKIEQILFWRVQHPLGEFRQAVVDAGLIDRDELVAATTKMQKAIHRRLEAELGGLPAEFQSLPISTEFKNIEPIARDPQAS